MIIKLPNRVPSGPTVLHQSDGIVEKTLPWPFATQDYSPLAWWRWLPPQAFHDGERQLLVDALREISVLHGGADLAAAMRGNPSAAIAAALGLMPIEDITIQVDVTLSALSRTALEGNAACALVMAQIIGLTDIGHELALTLAASWLAYGELHSDEPHKFKDARLVLLAAFEDGPNKSNT